MLFAPGIPEDRLQHLRHHRRLRQALTHPGWKQERVVAEFWDGKILLILPDDPKFALRKAEEVLSVVDAELGFPEQCRHSGDHSRDRSHVYLFVSPGGRVLGCLAAHRIRQAFRVLPEPGPAALRDSGNSGNCGNWQFPRAWRCSARPEPAVCGISRVWVLRAQRRRGIGRRMLDALRWEIRE
ncbi:hypothetical protein DV515_00016302 [Chloebia gouldiae]|uniref:N-acetyltransferase ESCO acetyl-transferase domain-containing protein n=1 Tax=Chloebia gouldiae TaxID=44316 RepID=A0A3L8RST7_CHLGU|nr:hypothetical protein DV515_00016302 [Chloebia gouldiae]